MLHGCAHNPTGNNGVFVFNSIIFRHGPVSGTVEENLRDCEAKESIHFL